MQWTTTALQLLAAAGIGGAISGLITQYAARGGDRRTARVEVRKALSVVERSRWDTDRPGDEFADDLQALMTAAMVAQVPRQLVDQYIYACQAARAALLDARNAAPELAAYRVSLGGGIDDLIEDLRDLFIDYLWHPWRKRYGLAAALILLEGRRKTIASNAATAGGQGRYLGYDYWPV